MYDDDSEGVYTRDRTSMQKNENYHLLPYRENNNKKYPRKQCFHKRIKVRKLYSDSYGVSDYIWYNGTDEILWYW